MEILMSISEKGYVAFVVYASFMFWISGVKIFKLNKRIQDKTKLILLGIKNNWINHIISNEIDICFMGIEIG